MELTPLAGRIFIEPDDAINYVTKSGFVVGPGKNKADRLRQAPKSGWIRHLAPDLEGEFNIGDKVVFNEPNPKGFKLNGERLIPISKDQVIAIIGE
jgi:co-chaperonin GroES (HSP10)